MDRGNYLWLGGALFCFLCTLLVFCSQPAQRLRRHRLNQLYLFPKNRRGRVDTLISVCPHPHVGEVFLRGHQIIFAPSPLVTQGRRAAG